VEEGATVTAYITAPLCHEAQRELGAMSGRAGEVRVRAVCLAPPETGGRLNLAAVGSGARRATEDSTAVAYLAERDPAALRFARPILEEAGIAVLADDSGSRAMARLVEAIDAADSSEGLRESVQDSLGG
jgi:hypothetical protein